MFINAVVCDTFNDYLVLDIKCNIITKSIVLIFYIVQDEISVNGTLNIIFLS